MRRLCSFRARAIHLQIVARTFHDNHHQYSRYPKRIPQTDGTDHYIRARNDHQDWLNTEQWPGYSDTYTKRFAQYLPTICGATELGDYTQRQLDKICQLTYDLYGNAAEILERMEENVLHPDFHKHVAVAEDFQKQLESEIDKLYPDAHPTWKLMYDSWLVRKVYVLKDWATLCRRKRAETLAKILEHDPSGWIFEEIRRNQKIAQSYCEKLEHLGQLWKQDPQLMVQQCGAMIGVNDREEMLIVAKRMKYRQSMKAWGLHKHDADVRPL